MSVPVNQRIRARVRGVALRRRGPRPALEAESNLYAEPKKLIAHGFASAHSEPRGKRRRTVYSITPSGKRALADWLGTAAPSKLERRVSPRR